MRRIVIILILTFLIWPSYSQRVERVFPCFCGNRAADQMIQYISEHLQIIVPPGKDLSVLNTQMRCKLTIDEHGKIVDIVITKHTVVWLELSIVDGLKSIPTSKEWNIEVAQELQKELVFSFGNWRKKKNEYGFDSEKIAGNIQQQLDQDRLQQEEKSKKSERAWSKVTNDDLKFDMPLSPERGKNPNPPMNIQSDDIPGQNAVNSKIQISLE